MSFTEKSNQKSIGIAEIKPIIKLDYLWVLFAAYQAYPEMVRRVITSGESGQKPFLK